MEWQKDTQEKFDCMIRKMPIFHRRMAQKSASAKAALLAQERGADAINEEDVVKAFFLETPKPFINLMVKLMKEVGFKYEQYQPKNT